MKQVEIKTTAYQAKWKDDLGKERYVNISTTDDGYTLDVDGYDTECDKDSLEVIYQMIGLLISEGA